jgi:hypothetical protein
MVTMGEDVTEKLVVVPIQFKVERKRATHTPMLI